MRAVDTNVLVRLIARDDSRQTVSAESFIQHGAWVPILALIEATWVLDSLYQLDSTALAEAIAMLLDHKNLVLQDHETVAAALQLFRSKPSLGFSDCLIFHSAHKAGHLPFGTFDKNLARVDGAQKL